MCSLDDLNHSNEYGSFAQQQMYASKRHYERSGYHSNSNQDLYKRLDE